MLVRGALGIAMSMFVLAVLAARPASAQDAGIAERADTTWDVRPDAGEVHLTIEVTLTNTTDDTPTTRTFWSSWGVALPFEPDSVTVRRGDTVLDHDLSSLDDGTPTVSWDFPDDLGADDQQTFVIDVTVASAPPRSTWEDGPRVDPAFVAVPIWAWGRDDADLRVRVPHAMGARLGPDEPSGRDGSDNRKKRKKPPIQNSLRAKL
jgi:hypothetical protein